VLPAVSKFQLVCPASLKKPSTASMRNVMFMGGGCGVNWVTKPSVVSWGIPLPNSSMSWVLYRCSGLSTPWFVQWNVMFASGPLPENDGGVISVEPKCIQPSSLFISGGIIIHGGSLKGG